MIKGLGLAVVISTMAMGCGGGTGGTGGSGGSNGGGNGGSIGGSGFNPGIASSTPLNKLSTAQAMQLCEQTGTYLNATFTAEANSKTFECQVAGNEAAALSFDATSSTNATVQKACQDVYTACLQAPVDAGADDVDAGTLTTDCTTSQTEIASCAATVAQYTACVDELNSAFANAFPTCAQLTIAKLASENSSDAGTDPFTSGPACTKLDTLCPDAAGDTSMTTSMLSATKSALKAARK